MTNNNSLPERIKYLSKNVSYHGKHFKECMLCGYWGTYNMHEVNMLYFLRKLSIRDEIALQSHLWEHLKTICRVWRHTY
jgi:hypothetical protein